MKVSDICTLLNGEIVSGKGAEKEVEYAFASDLMSDVLTVNCDNLLLITGLSNLQTIRTAEMSDAACILLVRDKNVTAEMVELAEEIGMPLIRCSTSMFRAAGLLFDAGIKPLY